MTAVSGQVPNVLVHTFNTRQPCFAVRQRLHTFRIARVPMVIGKRDDRPVRQMAAGREDLGQAAVDIGDVAAPPADHKARHPHLIDASIRLILPVDQ
jgi:hypothetical protein